MRSGLIILAILLASTTSALGQVSVGVDLPGVNIGINLPAYPELVRIPGYPVYYAPQVNSNYFFYDGLYWVFQNDNWYTSTWYDGPWELMDPDVVPLFLLRVPVRYYREPPAYFRGWVSSAPPRWGEHWGNGWADHHRGWDQWNRKAAPAPAPLPVYQRQYSGARYPRLAQQQALQSRNYRYQPRDAAVRQHYSTVQRAQNPPATSRPVRQPAPQASGAPQNARNIGRPPAAEQAARPPQGPVQRPPQAAVQRPPQAAAQRPPQAAMQRPPQARAPVAGSEGRAAPAKGPAREGVQGQKNEPGNGKQRNEERDK